MRCYLLSLLPALASTARLTPPVHAVRQVVSSTGCTQVSVTFNENVTTIWGESILLTGSVPELGNWNTSQAVPLSASQYTSTAPTWSCSVNMPLGTSFQYKFVKIGLDGTLSWEADPNRLYTTTTDCNISPILNSTWQVPPPTTTSAVSSVASVTAVATQPAPCLNGPTTRYCWNDGFDINTDFDNHWPDTGRVVSYNFEITNTTMAPDGYSRPVFAVNGQYPGPTIYADWGDVINVTVTNKLQANGTSIHFHGIRQYLSNQQDGVPGITQCPLAPNQSKSYVFKATQFGTSWVCA